MRVLLTGGSGTIGQEVLKRLCMNKNFQVTTFDIENRQTKKFYKPYQDRIRALYGDLSNKDAVMLACNEVDCVIHLAAIIPPMADENPSLANKINVIGTKNLISSLENLSPNAFFLFASSVSVYGDRLKNPFIRVGDPLLPSEGDEYAKTKIEAEQIIQACKLDWSIFRLSAVMGTNNHKISGLMFHMPLSTSLEITTPKDTARAFVNAIKKKQFLSKRIFNLGGGEACRMIYKELLTRSFSIFGLGKLDFPKHAFAEKNFHCGYYADGDELEEILAFREDTQASYFKDIESNISFGKKLGATLFRRRIKKHLLKLSEPFRAYRENDKSLLKRFF